MENNPHFRFHSSLFYFHLHNYGIEIPMRDHYNLYKSTLKLAVFF